MQANTYGGRRHGSWMLLLWSWCGFWTDKKKPTSETAGKNMLNMAIDYQSPGKWAAQGKASGEGRIGAVARGQLKLSTCGFGEKERSGCGVDGKC